MTVAFQEVACVLGLFIGDQRKLQADQLLGHLSVIGENTPFHPSPDLLQGQPDPFLVPVALFVDAQFDTGDARMSQCIF